MQCSMASYSPDNLVLAWELMGKSEPALLSETGSQVGRPSGHQLPLVSSG